MFITSCLVDNILFFCMIALCLRINIGHYLVISDFEEFSIIIAGSLEAAYSLNWGAREIWGKGGGETLALL